MVKLGWNGKCIQKIKKWPPPECRFFLLLCTSTDLFNGRRALFWERDLDNIRCFSLFPDICFWCFCWIFEAEAVGSFSFWFYRKKAAIIEDPCVILTPAAGFNTMFRACVPLKLSPTETIENTSETPQRQINFKNSNNHPTWKRVFSCQRVARKQETRWWWESWGFLTMADHGLWRMQFFEGQQVSGQVAHCHVSQKGKVEKYQLTLNTRPYG